MKFLLKSHSNDLDSPCNVFADVVSPSDQKRFEDISHDIPAFEPHVKNKRLSRLE
jgi:hypothetical protein